MTGLSPIDRVAIEAEFVKAVYQASRRAERQRRGELPVPQPSEDAYRLLRRVERANLGLDAVEVFESLGSEASLSRSFSLKQRSVPANVVGMAEWLKASVERRR